MAKGNQVSYGVMVANSFILKYRDHSELIGGPNVITKIFKVEECGGKIRVI